MGYIYLFSNQVPIPTPIEVRRSIITHRKMVWVTEALQKLSFSLMGHRGIFFKESICVERAPCESRSEPSLGSSVIDEDVLPVFEFSLRPLTFEGYLKGRVEKKEGDSIPWIALLLLGLKPKLAKMSPWDGRSPSDRQNFRAKEESVSLLEKNQPSFPRESYLSLGEGELGLSRGRIDEKTSWFLINQPIFPWINDRCSRVHTASTTALVVLGFFLDPHQVLNSFSQKRDDGFKNIPVPSQLQVHSLNSKQLVELPLKSQRSSQKMVKAAVKISRSFFWAGAICGGGFALWMASLRNRPNPLEKSFNDRRVDIVQNDKVILPRSSKPSRGIVKSDLIPVISPLDALQAHVSVSDCSSENASGDGDSSVYLPLSDLNSFSEDKRIVGLYERGYGVIWRSSPRSDVGSSREPVNSCSGGGYGLVPQSSSVSGPDSGSSSENNSSKKSLKAPRRDSFRESGDPKLMSIVAGRGAFVSRPLSPPPSPPVEPPMQPFVEKIEPTSPLREELIYSFDGSVSSRSSSVSASNEGSSSEPVVKESVNSCGRGFGPWLPENRSPPSSSSSLENRSSTGSHWIPREEESSSVSSGMNSPPPRPPQISSQGGFPQEGPVNKRLLASDWSGHQPIKPFNNASITDLDPPFKAFLLKHKKGGVDYTIRNGVVSVPKHRILRLYAEYWDRLRNRYNRR